MKGPGALRPGVLALTTLVLPATAAAYVCTRVIAPGDAGGPSLAWSTRTISFTLHAAGTADVPGTGELDAVRDGFAAWNGVVGCTNPGSSSDIVFDETATSTVNRIGYDALEPAENENLVIFRDGGWPHHPSVIALTTTTYNVVSGEIVDADIELNAESADFTVGDAGALTDIASTVAHEVGHVLGLGHSTEPTATMYASTNLGETSKRSLACDDRDALVFKYPTGAENGYCDPAEATCGGCAPPRVLEAVPVFTVLATDDGMGVCP